MSVSESVEIEQNRERPLRVVIVNKSDRTGGAAVVSRRLMEALRAESVDARMLVVEKLSGSEYVETVEMPVRYKTAFLSERLEIYLNNGFDRRDLFKVDTALYGLPLYRHPLIRQADVVCLGWVNQGMLSLRGIRRIKAPLVWIMHDMWNLTGICHHSHDCDRFRDVCCGCPYLHTRSREPDLSTKIQRLKQELYNVRNIRFVAVSNWLAGKARGSALLAGRDVRVINNPFSMEYFPSLPESDKVRKLISDAEKNPDRIRIVFGAARLDDAVKGFPILIAATESLKRDYPALAGKLELVTFGEIRDSSLLERIAIPHRYLGRLQAGDVRAVYENSEIVVSTSLHETLPGTLVEGQAFGCVPVCFNRGGQPDIVDHLSTGYMAEFSDDIEIAGRRIAEGIARMAELRDDEMLVRMRESVDSRFSPRVIAEKYISLFRELLQ